MKALFCLFTLSFFSASNTHLSAQRLVGKSAPVFELTAIDGRVVSTFKPGEVTVINFWFVGCPASMAQMPLLNRLAKDYPQVNMIGIAPHIPSALSAYCDSSNSSHLFARFREGSQLPVPNFPVVAACTQSPYNETNTIGPDCKRIAKDFRVKGYPYVFFVDRKGIVDAVENGFFFQPTVTQMAQEEAKYRGRLEALLAE